MTLTIILIVAWLSFSIGVIYGTNKAVKTFKEEDNT